MEANKNKRPQPRRQPETPKRASMVAARRRTTTGATFGETPQLSEVARGSRVSK